MDNYYIRRAVEPKDIFFHGANMDAANLSKIRSGLRKLHTFEVMAVNIYRLQITSEEDDLNLMIIQAMANEMTHVQDFQTKLYEYGTTPSPLRWAFWFAGMMIGFSSRLLGKKTMIKAGIWTEEKAVEDYQKIINSAQWDEETLKIIKNNLEDEKHHIQVLKNQL